MLHLDRRRNLLVLLLNQLHDVRRVLRKLSRRRTLDVRFQLLVYLNLLFRDGKYDVYGVLFDFCIDLGDAGVVLEGGVRVQTRAV